MGGLSSSKGTGGTALVDTEKDQWDDFQIAERKSDRYRNLSESDRAKTEASWKKSYGDEYVDPVTGRKASDLPGTQDETDKAIQKARTNAWYRSQMGSNAKSSMATGKLGGFDVSKPVLGGY